MIPSSTFSWIANPLSYTTSALVLDLNKCSPSSHLYMSGQTMYHVIGMCDGTVTTGNSLNKVISLQKWNMVNVPATIDWQYEYKI